MQNTLLGATGRDDPTLAAVRSETSWLLIPEHNSVVFNRGPNKAFMGFRETRHQFPL